MFFSVDEWDMDFISMEDFVQHVRSTLDNMYKKRDINTLKDFNKNLIDPVKLTFDSFTNNLDRKALINTEIIRQIDKSITNDIGAFHQYIFNYIDGWNVPKEGFDIENPTEKYFVELKNKHNTMNSSSSQKTYINLQNKILADSDATCMLVEIIAKRSQDIRWKVTVDKKLFNHEKIRRVSIDKFYEIATGDPLAFQKICSWLPITIKRINDEYKHEKAEEKVLDELLDVADTFMQGLYQQSFKSYNGFEDLNFKYIDELNRNELFT
ncbi:Eco47II family restriction endonuclease [Alkalihalobacillus sp. FSL R5-0424]